MAFGGLVLPHERTFGALQVWGFARGTKVETASADFAQRTAGPTAADRAEADQQPVRACARHRRQGRAAAAPMGKVMGLQRALKLAQNRMVDARSESLYAREGETCGARSHQVDTSGEARRGGRAEKKFRLQIFCKVRRTRHAKVLRARP